MTFVRKITAVAVLFAACETGVFSQDFCGSVNLGMTEAEVRAALHDKEWKCGKDKSGEYACTFWEDLDGFNGASAYVHYFFNDQKLSHVMAAYLHAEGTFSMLDKDAYYGTFLLLEGFFRERYGAPTAENRDIRSPGKDERAAMNACKFKAVLKWRRDGEVKSLFLTCERKFLMTFPLLSVVCGHEEKLIPTPGEKKRKTSPERQGTPEAPD
jgi:hypothetical protein